MRIKIETYIEDKKVMSSEAYLKSSDGYRPTFNVEIVKHNYFVDNIIARKIAYLAIQKLFIHQPFPRETNWRLYRLHDRLKDSSYSIFNLLNNNNDNQLQVRLYNLQHGFYKTIVSNKYDYGKELYLYLNPCAIYMWTPAIDFLLMKNYYNGKEIVFEFANKEWKFKIHPGLTIESIKNFLLQIVKEINDYGKQKILDRWPAAYGPRPGRIGNMENPMDLMELLLTLMLNNTFSTYDNTIHLSNKLPFNIWQRNGKVEWYTGILDTLFYRIANEELNVPLGMALKYWYSDLSIPDRAQVELSYLQEGGMHYLATEKVGQRDLLLLSDIKKDSPLEIDLYVLYPYWKYNTFIYSSNADYDVLGARRFLSGDKKSTVDFKLRIATDHSVPATNLKEIAEKLDSYISSGKLSRHALFLTFLDPRLRTYDTAEIEIYNHPDIVPSEILDKYGLKEKVVLVTDGEDILTQLRITKSNISDIDRWENALLQMRTNLFYVLKKYGIEDMSPEELNRLIEDIFKETTSEESVSVYNISKFIKEQQKEGIAHEDFC